MGCRPNKPLHITDQQPMLALMQRNIALNGLQSAVNASVYNWGGARPAGVPTADVVLAADCVYFEPAFPLLQRTLEDLIGPETVCYFSFKKRRRADLHFMKAVRKAFVVQEVENDPDRPGYARENISLYSLLPPACREMLVAQLTEDAGAPSGGSGNDERSILQTYVCMRG